jgi:diguanylate cyclase (GGDEF)-like protein
LELANRALGDSLHKLTDISETDQLTGLRNRYAFEKYIEREIARIKRAGTSIAAILIDVDFFKKYNDMYGHLEGDACLQAVAKAIKQGARRAEDFLARYGGEEFVVILSGMDLAGAIATANHIRDALAESAIRHDGSPHRYLSMSMGIFCLPAIPFSLDTKWVRDHVLNGADHALYRAKNGGRNAIHVAEIEQLEVVKQKLDEPA